MAKLSIVPARMITPSVGSVLKEYLEQPSYMRSEPIASQHCIFCEQGIALIANGFFTCGATLCIEEARKAK